MATKWGSVNAVLIPKTRKMCHRKLKTPNISPFKQAEKPKSDTIVNRLDIRFPSENSKRGNRNGQGKIPRIRVQTFPRFWILRTRHR